MRSLVIVALLAAATTSHIAAASAVHAEHKKAPVNTKDYPDYWEDLFAPPFTNAPMIIESIGCSSGNLCYVPAGDNGVGFQVMSFDGQINGNFTIMATPEGGPMDIFTSMGVGGPSHAPHGLTGGFMFPQYRRNSTTWLLPWGAPVTATIDIRVDSKTGKNMVFYNAMGQSPSVTYSSDGGATMKSHQLPPTPPLPNAACMWPRFTTMAGSPDVLFQTFGNWPGNDNIAAKDSATGSSMKTKTGKIPYHMVPERLRKVLGNCGYNAGIAKSTDGGKTWKQSFAVTKDFYFNQIDCQDAMHCVVVGQSIYNHTGPTTGSRIYYTEDGGEHWTLALHRPSNTSYWSTLFSVRFSRVHPTTVWAGGAQNTGGMNRGLILKSEDSGKTWKQFELVEYIAEILDFSFTEDGNAFASAITVFSDSTILRYNANGPAPTTLPPYTGKIKRITCSDNSCSKDCKVDYVPQHQCMNETGGGSAMFRCRVNQRVVIQNYYPLSDHCSFLGGSFFFGINQCYLNAMTGTGSLMFSCGDHESDNEQITKPVAYNRFPAGSAEEFINMKNNNKKH